MNSDKIRIAIVGAGALGAYYGCMLARQGHEVSFLARGDYAIVKKQGYEIRCTGETFRIHPARVFQKASDIGHVDLVIIALKATANHTFPELVLPLVGPGTHVLTLQNGMGNVEALAQLIPAVQILGGLCFVCINRVAPGIIENYLPGRVFIGEFIGSYRERTMRIARLFEEAGVDCHFSRSLEESLWRKLCWNIPFNGLSIAGGGISTDQILASPALTTYARHLMKEVQAAAKAYGYTIGDDFLEEQFHVTHDMGPYKPSSLLDYLSGRQVEVEAIFGQPLQRGTDKRVPMPYLRSLHLLLEGLCQQ